jgi:aminoglycoside phosphotransferase (APT) family kinase protein
VKPDDIAARLTLFLERETGGPVRIANVRTMTGGATREAWSLDVTVQDAGAPRDLGLVLLLFRPGGQRAFSARDEFRLLAATGAAGAPVPKPMFVGEEALGRPFYMMERLSGETIGRRLVREERFAEARRVLPVQLAEALAVIHRVPLDGRDGCDPLDFLPRPETGKPVVASELERLEAMYRQITVEPHPAFEIAFRWLAERQPTSTDVALVHGDFRIGNVMIGEEGLRAVLDWELAHAGDPFEDRGWGSACARGASASTTCRWAASRAARSCSTPTRVRADGPSTRRSCASGRSTATCAGACSRWCRCARSSRGCRTASSSRASGGAPPRRSGSC